MIGKMKNIRNIITFPKNSGIRRENCIESIFVKAKNKDIIKY